MLAQIFLLLAVVVLSQGMPGGSIVSKYAPSNDWTIWLDRDDPSVTGDWETVEHFFPRPCRGQADIMEARVKGDYTVILSTTKRITVGPKFGLQCINRLQYGSRCVDFKMHYLLPGLSPLFDRDDPSGFEDHELKKLHGWRKGRFIYWTSDSHLNYGLIDERVEIGPRYGLRCLKSEQMEENPKCRDYEVRFHCPEYKVGPSSGTRGATKPPKLTKAQEEENAKAT